MAKGSQAQQLRKYAPAVIACALVVLLVVERSSSYRSSLVSLADPSDSQFEDPQLNQIYNQALRESLRDSKEISRGFEWKHLKNSASQPAEAPKQQQLQAPAVKKSEETKEDERLSSGQARSDLSAFFTHMEKSHSDSAPHEHVELKKAPAVKGLSESTKRELQALMGEKQKAKLMNQVKQQKHDIRILEHMLVDSLAAKSNPVEPKATETKRSRHADDQQDQEKSAEKAFANILAAAAANERPKATEMRSRPVKDKQDKEKSAEKAFANILAAAAASELSHAAREKKSSKSRSPKRWEVEGYMDADEGGSQLASFALPAPPQAAKCPPCGFLPDCQVNPAAVGRSRATGMFNAYPSMPQSNPVWGSGGAHLSTLALSSGGINQDVKPLWNKLGDIFRPAARKLLSKEPVEDEEGGSTRVEELASFALPAAPQASPPPKCVCPACKLGDERIGFEDEKHSKSDVSQEELVGLIDDELMKLDPQYAAKRMEFNGAKDSLLTSTQGWWPAGRANPFSDFSGAQEPYGNEVVKKRATVW